MGTQRWQRAIAIALGMSGAIRLSISPAIAQSNIVEDPTVGTVVTPNFFGFPIEAIHGGTERGQNLFHSFQEFNVSSNRIALFLIPNGTIQNVFARVTGRNLSRIDGALATLLDGSFAPSAANLFVINPNGIIFGAGASLDVGGSFVATTANAIQFSDRGNFSATNPGVPSAVLTINPSAFLFDAIAAQNLPDIIVQSNAANPLGGIGLQVPNGQNLLLVGGDVRLEGGILQAPGGRVELTGLSAPGAIGLTPTGNNFQLAIPTNISLADVSLTRSLANQSAVNVAAGGGGSIAVNARNLDIVGGSFLRSGIQSGSNLLTRQAGDITLNVRGMTQVDGAGGGVFNLVQSDAKGNAGNITVNTGFLSITNGAVLSSNILGQGNAGNISIVAHDSVTIDGTSGNGQVSGVGSQIFLGGVGRGGNISN